MKLIPEEKRVYIDEAGVDDTLCYAFGWSPRNTRCVGEKLGHRTRRISMAAWCCGQVFSPLTFEGYCNSALIESWVAQQLGPALQAGQVVILDNASFHSIQRLTPLVEAVGCSILPLPKYSPDLNKIEPLWNQTKRKIMFDTGPLRSFREKVDKALA